MSGKEGSAPPEYPGPGYQPPGPPQYNTQYGMQQPGYSAAPGYTQPPPGAHMQYGNVVVAAPPMQSMHQQGAPIDYTTQAWIACLCCFWPTGLLAIMKANQSRDALVRGDVAGAHMAADGARTMVRISWIAGIISIIVAVVIVIIYVVVILNTINNYDY